MTIPENILMYIIAPYIIIFLILFAIGFCLTIYYYYLFGKVKILVKKLALDKKIPLSAFYPFINYLDIEYIKKLKNKELQEYLKKAQFICKLCLKILLTLVISFGLLSILMYLLFG